MVFEEKEYMIGDKKILLRSAKTEEAPLSITSLEQPAAKLLLLYFFFRDFSSMSFVLFEGLMRATAQISPVSSSAAKSTFSISKVGSTSIVVPFPTVIPYP